MDRRRFLVGATAVVASAALPIPMPAAKAMVKPAAKLVATGNVLLTQDQVATEALRILRMNYAAFSLQREVHRQKDAAMAKVMAGELESY